MINSSLTLDEQSTLHYSPKNSEDEKTQRSGTFPIRPFTNILLIILTSIQVLLILNSDVYLRGDLVRSFLSVYVDAKQYPQLFDGNSFYLQITNVTELQKNIQFMFESIAFTNNFLNINYKKANITLQVGYQSHLQSSKTQYIFPIDSNIGIIQPFDCKNITSLQLFLLEIDYFKISLSGLQMESQGFYERYLHGLVYRFQDGNQIDVTYQFQIDDSLIGSLEVEQPQANYLYFLQAFYLIIILIALVSLYINTVYVRRTFKEFYRKLEQNYKQRYELPSVQKRRTSIFEQLSREDIRQIDQNVLKWVQTRGLTLSQVRWEHYLFLLEFDVLFSALANVFQVIGSFYLIFGRQHERIVGLSCMLSWMTLFRILKNYKHLVLMYQLIKLSFVRVAKLLISFIIVFMAYTFLGMCLFPKVTFFCSLSRSVTTLASMMAGDSISEITFAITEKYTTVAAVSFIFSYVIIFMHAIYNTLTSIIKQFFILKKIELLQEKKKRRGHENFIYLQESQLQSDKIKKSMPLKFSEKLQMEIMRIKRQQTIKSYGKTYQKLCMLIEEIGAGQRWEIIEFNIQRNIFYNQELRRRLERIGKLFQKTQKNNLFYLSRISKGSLSSEQPHIGNQSSGKQHLTFSNQQS